jgi:hypothetical protein
MKCVIFTQGFQCILIRLDQLLLSQDVVKLYCIHKCAQYGSGFSAGSVEERTGAVNPEASIQRVVAVGCAIFISRIIHISPDQGNGVH